MTGTAGASPVPPSPRGEVLQTLALPDCGVQVTTIHEDRFWKLLFVFFSPALVVFGRQAQVAYLYDSVGPNRLCVTHHTVVCDTPVSCQCLAVISFFFKDPFLYLLGILIFPSHCFASYWLKKKKGAKALFGNRILMRRLRKKREMVEAFVPVRQKMENAGEEMWMCMGKREGGEKKELFKITARKSFFQSTWPQQDQFSISVSLPFVFQDTCMPLEMGDLPATVCLKQIVGRYFFQMSCFLDQFNML